MQSMHVVVPGKVRAAIISQARAEGVSAGEVMRSFLTAGMRARGIEV
jgi:hypothetical protein